MYDKRIKNFVIVSAIFLLLCLFRLAQMQLLPDSSLHVDIAELKKGISRQLKTVRGKILDRNGKVIAVDQPQFYLCIDYKLSCFLDERVRRAKLLKAERDDKPALFLSELQQQLQTKIEDVQSVIDKCTYFGLEHDSIVAKITEINDKIWNLREYLAWKRNFPDMDFEQAVPDADERLLLTNRIDIAEMYESFPLFQLQTDDDIFTAQLLFIDTNAVEILPKTSRLYPYGSVAAQTIGWVGPATQQQDKNLFESDRLASYLEGELCGREDGIEYICETRLRGRRGEKVYDIERKLISKTETQFGEDVQLTIDIELQKRIENYLADSTNNPANYNAPTAAVVVDVDTGDILALVSLPVFDLNRARFDYDRLANEPNQPLLNRSINKQYPPGSVVKPLILIAGLESGKITADEIISCPAEKAPFGWPSCWLYNKYKWACHDDKWPNNARNAIKGSCNIYFSRLADRIEPEILQQWLFKFGYGHHTQLSSFGANGPSEKRELRNAQGIISSTSPADEIVSFEQIPPLLKAEERLFGIGQGNLRATPLQVANAMAAIARAGVYKPSRLFLTPDTMSSEGRETNNETDIGISPETLRIVYDGMGAVVNEQGGTAYNEFAPSGLAEQAVKVYGKTGSTEKPDNAWFAGFAKDDTGRKLAIAVVVEGGQQGSADAAPLARDIIQFCIEAGYIGKNRIKTE